ncbi:hypothetical protein GCM10011533_31290 [Streptosporangium jomthongense]|nr:hypothetical protein GCM10011533_31290 [Streptosporangium jomthongense]
MLFEDGFRVRLEQAVQPQSLIHLIKMVHEVIIPDNLAEAAAATFYKTVILAGTECQAGGAEQGVRRVQNVGNNTGTAPGIESYSVCRMGTFSAGACRNACRRKTIEFRAALAGQ